MSTTDNKNVAVNQEMNETVAPAVRKKERDSLSLSRLQQERFLELSSLDSSSRLSSSLYQTSQNSTSNWLEVEKFYQDEFDSAIHGPFHDIYKKGTTNNRGLPPESDSNHSNRDVSLASTSSAIIVGDNTQEFDKHQATDFTSNKSSTGVHDNAVLHE